MNEIAGGPLTVSQLTDQIKEAVEGGFSRVFVLGEISNVRQAASGHIYLTLEDENASISAVIWRSTDLRLGFDLTDGMDVLVGGRLMVYAPRGRYQLDIRALKTRGVGPLRKAFEALHARLLMRLAPNLSVPTGQHQAFEIANVHPA